MLTPPNSSAWPALATHPTIRLRTRLAAGLAAALALAACAPLPSQPPAAFATTLSATPPAAPEQPEIATGQTAKSGWVFRQHAVAAAHPLAAEAGRRILQAGGSAVDAAVAVQMVLALVEPQSSGIGGGAFMLHSSPDGIDAYDGRETAPADARPHLFLKADGQPMDFHAAAVGGRAVGVPGAVAMLALAHRDHGVLPWARLFESAIELAEEGFAVSPRLHAQLAADRFLRLDPTAAAYFYDPQGRPWPIGHRLRNPELAHVLRALAAQGPSALYEGPVAQAIVAKVRGHASNPGLLTAQDLAAYRAVKRQALCHDHPAPAGMLRVCGFPPPSSGAIAVGQILGILAQSGGQATAATPPPARLDNGLPGPQWLHRYAEASRLAFADRALYVADPDFVPPPAGGWGRLLAPAYLARRARLIGPARMEQAPAGRPDDSNGPLAYAPMPEQPEFGTSHISIVDARGHAVAMTTTVEDAFGSRQMVSTHPARPGGFLLNNQLTDFSFQPADAQGRPVANRVEPGKRPRSSMAPTLVFERTSGALQLVAGSPGGAHIIHFTTKTLLGTLEWGLTPQQAADLPNFGTVGGPLVLEEQRFAPGTVQALRALGGEVREAPLTSGVHVLQRAMRPGPGGTPTPVWLGGADPRREGTVAGD